MNSKHLSEAAIQQYGIDPANCDDATHAHILSCEQCRLKSVEYKILFGGIKELERPSFEMDLAALVLPRLVPEKKSKRIPIIFLYFLVALPITGLLIYLFKTSLAGLLIGVSTIFIGLVTTSILGIVCFLGVDAYLQFKKQMNQLNYFKNLQH